MVMMAHCAVGGLLALGKRAPLLMHSTNTMHCIMHWIITGSMHAALDFIERKLFLQNLIKEQCAINVKFTPQRPICSELFWIRVRSKHALLVVVVVMILLFLVVVVLVLVVSVVVLVVGQPNPIPAAASSPTLLSRHCSRPTIIIIITNMTTTTIIVSKSAVVLLNEVEISTWLWFVRVVTVFSSPADASCNFKPGIYQCKPIPPQSQR